MHFLLFFSLFVLRALCIFEDEFDQDWLRPEIGSIGESFVVGDQILALTDTKFFIGLTTVFTKDDSPGINFRRAVYDDPMLYRVADNVNFVGSTQNGLFYLNLYNDHGDLLNSKVFNGVKNMASIGEKVILQFKGHSVLVSKSFGITDIPAFDKISHTSIWDDKFIISTDTQISIYDQNWDLLHYMKRHLDDLKLNCFLSQGSVFKIDFNYKVSKISKADLITEFGYLKIDNNLKLFNYEGELLFDSELTKFEINDCLFLIDDQIRVVDLETGVELDSSANNIKNLDNLKILYNDKIQVLLGLNGSEYYENGSLVWSREDLSKTKNAIIVDSPIKFQNLESNLNSNPVQNYFLRLRKNLGQILKFKLGDVSDLNYFGFDKKLVILNQDKLYIFDIYERTLIKKMVLDREFKYLVNEGKSLIKIISEDGLVRVYDLDLELVNEIIYDTTVTKIHNIDKQWYIQSGNKIHPATDSYIVDADDKTVSGYHIVDGIVHKTWSFPLTTEKLILISKRPDPNNDSVLSIGKVLPDRSVMYKYLIPNLCVITTYNEEGLYLRLVDIVTGEILMTQKHDNDEEFIDYTTVKVIYDENFICYTYNSLLPSMGVKLVMMDLYESSNSNEKVSSGGGSQFDIIKRPPHTTQKSFNLAQRVLQMSTSTSKFGISTKSVILVLANGQVISIPRYLIDANMNEIEINEQMVLSNYHEAIFDEEPIILTEPSNVESTSQICVIGNDIYCTRFSPSGKFDILSDRFEKGKLMLTIGIMLAGVLVLKPMIGNKKLNSQWMIPS